MLPLQNKVFLLTRRWTHHSDHSGYDIVGKYVGTMLFSKPVPDFLLPDKLFWNMTRNMHGYDRTGAALEMLTFRHMSLHKGCVYHFIYGENTYNFIGYLNGWRGHRIVATYHMPPKHLAEQVRTYEPVRRLSAVFLMGRNQIEFLEGVLPKDRIHFMPYAVDTKFFVPPTDFQERENNLCLFVGIHLRDYGTLRSVIENAWLVSPKVRFVIVTSPSKRKELDGTVGNYEILTNIAESELLCLYQKATLLVMPLEDTTTNTAVLEAMSCGLPMVVTDIGAARDYVNPEFAHLVSPYDVEEMLGAILFLLQSDARRIEMATSARKHALAFDWNVISKRMIEVYNGLLG